MPSVEDAQKIENEKKGHMDLAESSYREKRQAKEESLKNKNFVFVIFDLQKCLPTPMLSSSIAFYKRSLWTPISLFTTLLIQKKLQCVISGRSWGAGNRIMSVPLHSISSKAL